MRGGVGDGSLTQTLVEAVYDRESLGRSRVQFAISLAKQIWLECTGRREATQPYAGAVVVDMRAVELCEDSRKLRNDATWIGGGLLELYLLLSHLIVGLFAVGGQE